MIIFYVGMKQILWCIPVSKAVYKFFIIAKIWYLKMYIEKADFFQEGSTLLP